MPLSEFQSDCHERASKIVSKDLKCSRRHIGNNKDKDYVTHYRIDGNVIKTGKRCDFLLINETKKKAYLIEIKGSDLSAAVEQVCATARDLKAALQPYDLHYRIVSSKSRGPEVRTGEVLSFRRKYKEKQLIKTERIEEDI